MEWIYILKNSNFPKWYKIGRTACFDPYDRLDQYTHHQPFGEVSFYALFLVEDSTKIETETLSMCEDKKYHFAKKEWIRVGNSKDRSLELLLQYINRRSIRRVI